jgi:signal transduction histidine kinase
MIAAIASSELMALCETQLALLSLDVGASLSAIYLTQAQTETPQWVPLLAYPPTGQAAQVSQVRETDSPPPAALGESPSPVLPGIDYWLAEVTAASRPIFQRILPLRNGERLLGVLITRRDDRDWRPKEAETLVRIANTLAFACSLDENRIWLEQENHLLRDWQLQQQDRLDTLAHQLKNPLTALRTFAKLLLRRLQAGDRNQTAAEGILRESERLEWLIRQLGRPDVDVIAALPPAGRQVLLPASAAEPIPTQPCQLSLLLAPLLDNARAIALERHLHLDVPVQEAWAIANAGALVEVLSNLLDNALKYTPAGGTVGVQIQTQADQVQVGIWDTGPGIPVADREQLFQRHFRGVQAQGEIAGSGLGLAIARDLTERMGGHLEVFSPASLWSAQLFKRGSVFVVTLPVTLPPVVPILAQTVHP